MRTQKETRSFPSLLHHYIQIMGQYKFVLGRIISEIKILKKLESGKKRKCKFSDLTS